MKERSITHTTFSIGRTYGVAPARVFAAFSDPAKKRRWFAEGEGFAISEFEMDFRVGGKERTRFQSKDGATFQNDTVFMDILPGRHIVLGYTMSAGDKHISSSQASFEFLPSSEGTELLLTEQAAFFEGADGPQMREEGWRLLLEQLAAELVA